MISIFHKAVSILTKNTTKIGGNQQNTRCKTTSNSQFDAWYEGRHFSVDWTSSNFQVWSQHLNTLKNDKVTILELGSWEGRSAIFFLNFFTKSHLTCVDTFSGGIENHTNSFESSQIEKIEGRFDKNLADFSQRMCKLKLPTHIALAGELRDRSFDIIYIDASHQRDDVLIDSLLGWKLLRRFGILIWDDYGGGVDKPDKERVRSAVDIFLKLHKNDYKILHLGYQVIIQRINDI